MADVFVPLELLHKYTEPLRQRVSRFYKKLGIDESALYRLAYSAAPDQEMATLLSDILLRSVKRTRFDPEALANELLQYSEQVASPIARDKLVQAASDILLSGGKMVSLLSMGYVSYGLEKGRKRSGGGYGKLLGMAAYFAHTAEPPTSTEGFRKTVGNLGRALARSGRQPTHIRLETPITGKEGIPYTSLLELVEDVTSNPETVMMMKEEIENIRKLGAISSPQEGAQLELDLLMSEFEQGQRLQLPKSFRPAYGVEKIEEGLRHLGPEQRIYTGIARKVARGGEEEYVRLSNLAMRKGDKERQGEASGIMFMGYHMPASIPEQALQELGIRELQQVSIGKVAARQIARVLSWLGDDIYSRGTMEELRKAFLRHGYLDPQSPPPLGRIVETARSIAPQAFHEEAWQFLEELERAHARAESDYTMGKTMGIAVPYDIFRRDRTIGYGEIVSEKVRAIRNVGRDYSASFPIGEPPPDTSRTVDIEERKQVDWVVAAPIGMSEWEVYRRIVRAGNRFALGEPAPETEPGEYYFTGYSAVASHLLERGLEQFGIPTYSSVKRLGHLLQKERTPGGDEGVSQEDYELLRRAFLANVQELEQVIPTIDPKVSAENIQTIAKALSPFEELSQQQVDFLARQMRTHLRGYTAYLFDLGADALQQLGFRVEPGFYFGAHGGAMPLPETGRVGLALGLERREFRIEPEARDEESGVVYYRIIPNEYDEDTFFLGQPLAKPAAQGPRSEVPAAPTGQIAWLSGGATGWQKDPFEERLELASIPPGSIVQAKLQEMNIGGDYYVAHHIRKRIMEVALASEADVPERVRALRKLSPAESAVVSRFVRDALQQYNREFWRKYGAHASRSQSVVDIISNFPEFDRYMQLSRRTGNVFGINLEQMAESFDLRRMLMVHDAPEELQLIGDLIKMAQGPLTQEPVWLSEREYLQRREEIEANVRAIETLLQPGQTLFTFDIETKPVDQFRENDPSSWYLTEIGWSTIRYMGPGQYERLQSGYASITAQPVMPLSQVIADIRSQGREAEALAWLRQEWERAGKTDFPWSKLEEVEVPELLRVGRAMGSFAAENILATYSEGARLVKEAFSQIGLTLEESDPTSVLRAQNALVTGYNVSEYDLRVIQNMFRALGLPTEAVEQLQESALDVMQFMRANVGIGGERVSLERLARNVELGAINLFGRDVGSQLLDLVSEKVRTTGGKHNPVIDANATVGVLLYYMEHFKDIYADKLEEIRRAFMANDPQEVLRGRLEPVELSEEQREKVTQIIQEGYKRSVEQLSEMEERARQLGVDIRALPKPTAPDTPVVLPREPEPVARLRRLGHETSRQTTARRPFEEIRRVVEGTMPEDVKRYGFMRAPIRYRPGEQQLLNRAIDWMEFQYRLGKKRRLGEDELGNWVAQRFASGLRLRDELMQGYSQQNLPNVLGIMHQIASMRASRQEISAKLQEQLGVSAEEAERIIAAREYVLRNRLTSFPYFVGQTRYEPTARPIPEENLPWIKAEEQTASRAEGPTEPRATQGPQKPPRRVRQWSIPLLPPPATSAVVLPEQETSQPISAAIPQLRGEEAQEPSVARRVAEGPTSGVDIPMPAPATLAMLPGPKPLLALPAPLEAEPGGVAPPSVEPRGVEAQQARAEPPVTVPEVSERPAAERARETSGQAAEAPPPSSGTGARPAQRRQEPRQTPRTPSGTVPPRQPPPPPTPPEDFPLPDEPPQPRREQRPSSVEPPEQPEQPTARPMYNPRQLIDAYLGLALREERGTHTYMRKTLFASPIPDLLRFYSPGAEYGEAFVTYGERNEVTDFGFRGKYSITEGTISSVTGRGQITSAFDVAERAFVSALHSEYFSEDPLLFQTELRKRVYGRVVEITQQLLDSIKEADVADPDTERKIINGIRDMAVKITDKFVTSFLSIGEPTSPHMTALNLGGYGTNVQARASVAQNISSVGALKRALEADEQLRQSFIERFTAINEQTLQTAIDQGSVLLRGSGNLLYNIGKYASADFLDIYDNFRRGSGGGQDDSMASFWRNLGVRMMYGLYYARMMYKDIIGERLQAAEQYGAIAASYAPIGNLYGGLGQAGYAARAQSYEIASARASYENLGGLHDVVGMTMAQHPWARRMLNAAGIALTSYVGGHLAGGLISLLPGVGGTALAGVASVLPTIGLVAGATALTAVGANELYNLITGERKSITERIHEGQARAVRQQIALRLGAEMGYIPVAGQAGLIGFYDQNRQFIPIGQAFSYEQLVQAARPEELGYLALYGPGVEQEKKYEEAARNIQAATGFSEKELGPILARLGVKYYGKQDWLTDEMQKQLIHLFSALSSRGYSAETALQLGDIARKYGYALTKEEAKEFTLRYAEEPFDIEEFERTNQGYVVAGGFMGQFLKQPWQGAYWARQMGIQTQAQASFIVPYMSHLSQLGYPVEDYQSQIEEVYKKLGASAQYYAPVFGVLTTYGGYTPEQAFSYVSSMPQLSPAAGTMLGRMIGGDLSAISYVASLVSSTASDPYRALLARGFRFLNAAGQPIYQTSLGAFQQLVRVQAILGNPLAQGGLQGLNRLVSQMPSEDLAAWVSGGQMSREWLYIRRQFDHQMQGYQLQQTGIDIQRQYFQQSNVLEDRMRQLQHRARLADFAAQYARLDMERRHFAQDMALRWERLMLGRGYEQAELGRAQRRIDIQRGYQLWQLDFERQGMQLQQQWTRAAWQRQDTMQFLQHGWQMEDLGIAISRSFGFQRRQLMKQQERENIMFALRRQDIEAGRDVQEEVWKREEEAYNKKREYILSLMELDKEDFEARKKQADELFQLAVKEFETQKRQREEIFEFQLRELNRQKEEYEKIFKMQEQQIKLQRQYQEDQLKLQQDQLALARRQADEAFNYQTQVKTISDLYSQIVGYFREMQHNNPTSILNNLVLLVSDMSRLDSNKLLQLRSVIQEIAWLSNR